MFTRLPLLAPLALHLLLASPAVARVVPAPTSDSNLAQALAAALPGDTLQLPRGELGAGGLRLPDGITLLGDPAGTVIRAKKRQSLFVIEGATDGVTLANLEIKGARSREMGGAIRARDSRLTLRGVTIRDCRSAQEGGALFMAGGRLEITDCQFLENRAKRGGAIALKRGEAEEGNGWLVADNVLFAGNRAERGSALASGLPVTIDHGTFVVNRAEAGAVCETQDSLSLLNCNLVGNSQGVAGAGPVSSGSTLLDIRFTNLQGNPGGDWVGELAALAGTQGNRCLEPGFVSPDHSDFRLRWDSPLLDIGDPGLPLDFDLTRADIGWSPYHEERILSQDMTEDLGLHNYRVAEDLTISGAIPAGATIRVDSGKFLSIRVPGSGSEYTIGDANGPRTAIVGRPSPEAQSAAAITFVPPSDGAQRPLQFEGTLFNYPPIRNGIAQLTFGATTGTPLEVDLSGDDVQFKYYRNVPINNGTSEKVDATLSFQRCTGVVEGLDFGLNLETDPGRLALYNSALRIENCGFTPSSTDTLVYKPPLKIIGSYGATTPVLHGCSFLGNAHQQGPLAHFTQTVQRLESNWLEGQATLLGQFNTAVDMGQEARNDFRDDASSQWQDNQPLIDIEGGDLDLFCGRNNFLVESYLPNWPIVAYSATSQFPDTNSTRNWRENFWGTSCTAFIPESDLNNPAFHLLPHWAHVEASLGTCMEITIPDNPACPYEALTPLLLLKFGNQAYLDGEYAAAQENYYYLLTLHPKAPEITEGTLRLKDLGQHKTWGLEHATEIRDLLFAAADLSEATELHLQAVFQDCSGWCVEALGGDRPWAIDALETMLAQESDPKCIDTINMALLEIATYPPQGGNSAAGPGAANQRLAVQQEAVQALFDYRCGQSLPAQQAEETMPASFGIRRLYPNPFNPVTTIEVDLPADGHLRLRVFNLLGQQVATLADQELKAGQQRIRFDGTALASGMYLAVADYQGQNQVRKMLLVK